VLGIGALLPWNVFLTAFEYWTFVFPTFHSFEFAISLAYNYPNLIVIKKERKKERKKEKTQTL